MKEVTKEVYLKWYEDMLLWRKFEDKLAALYIQQKVRGPRIWTSKCIRACGLSTAPQVSHERLRG